MRTFTHENFQEEVLNSKVPVIVDFFATWCGPCKALHPLLEKLEAEHPDFVFGQVDIDEEPELLQTYRSMSVPTVKLFAGGTAAGTAIGLSTEDELLDLMASAK